MREEQPTLWGYTPHRGHIEIRMRADVDEASMFALWLSGIEDRPERSGEICVAEIFGDSIRGDSVEVGMGIHRFRDPTLVEEFTRIRLQLDTTAFHDYSVDWTEHGVEFLVDGRCVYRVAQSPDYPMQLMVGVFDFPARRTSSAPAFTPQLVVSRVIGRPLPTLP